MTHIIRTIIGTIIRVRIISVIRFIVRIAGGVLTAHTHLMDGTIIIRIGITGFIITICIIIATITIAIRGPGNRMMWIRYSITIH